MNVEFFSINILKTNFILFFTSILLYIFDINSINVSFKIILFNLYDIDKILQCWWRILLPTSRSNVVPKHIQQSFSRKVLKHNGEMFLIKTWRYSNIPIVIQIAVDKLSWTSNCWYNVNTVTNSWAINYYQ